LRGHLLEIIGWIVVVAGLIGTALLVWLALHLEYSFP
jgi:hypothetical protein